MTMGLLIGLIICANAQGIKVTYMEEIKTPESVKELSPEIKAAVEAQFKQQNKTMCLYSQRGESVYVPAQTGSDTPSQQGNLNVQTIRMGGGSVIYKNQHDRQIISQEYILDKQFLIAEELNIPAWKIGTEEKTVGNFNCKKATNEAGDVAWYCPEIPVNEGPGTCFGLPGLVLELETPSKTIAVQEINLKYDTSKDIKKPESGKKITREEFNSVLKKKMEEMGVGGGDDSGVRIIKM
jgi:GLPGLI family protein